jgi:hypothetical protein
MKLNKTLYLLALPTIIFFSCAKEDEEVVPPPVPQVQVVPEVPSTVESLTGVWEFSKEIVLVNGVETTTDYKHTFGCQKDYVIFTPSKTLISTKYRENMGVKCFEDLLNFSYVLSGETLTLTPLFPVPTPTTYIFKIVNKSKDEVKFSGDGRINILKKI